jgi:hypothetical protein
MPTTCSATHRTKSSSRQRSRFVPGSRHIGGSDFGLRLTSLRMLLTDLWILDARSSTVRRLSIGDTSSIPLGC